MFRREKTKVLRRGKSLIDKSPKNILEEFLLVRSCGTIEKFEVRREEQQSVNRVKR